MITSELVHHHFTLRNVSGEFIHGDVRFGGNGPARQPVILICHSFMAFKEWGFFPHLSERLARSGFVTVSFNFSRNGVFGNDDRITQFKEFERNSFLHELDDLGTVIDGVLEGQVASTPADREKVVLLGHSRGGGVAILRAASDSRVSAMITLSAISTFDRWTAHQKERWRNLGYLPLAKDSVVSPLRLGIGLLEELEDHRDKLDIAGAASRVTVPWLLIHGKADVTVPSREAEVLYNASNKSTSELILLERVGHLYNAASESEDQYRTLNNTIDLVASWLHRTL